MQRRYAVTRLKTVACDALRPFRDARVTNHDGCIECSVSLRAGPLHVDVPRYHKPLIVTGAALNILR
jgi:hypothetical protein